MARHSKTLLSYCRVGDMDGKICGGAEFYHQQRKTVNATVEVIFFPLSPFRFNTLSNSPSDPPINVSLSYCRQHSSLLSLNASECTFYFDVTRRFQLPLTLFTLADIFMALTIFSFLDRSKYHSKTSQGDFIESITISKSSVQLMTKFFFFFH